MTASGTNTMQVVALSAAKPRWQDVRGHPVFTSIVREPAPGPLRFQAGGPDDNETAVHTEAVLAMPAEHYDHWAGAFGAARGDWNWCHFGENLVLSGLDENSLRVGDLLKVGAAVFQVTSPRIPCFKLAWRLGQPDSVLARMIESGRVGFYLAVVTPGRVSTGDAVTVESPDPAAITVGDLSRLLGGNHGTPERLRAVLANPALGGQARGMLAKRIAGLEDALRLKQDRWSGWRPFRVAAMRAEAQDIASFDLVPEDAAPLAPPLAGQFLTVRLGDGDDAPVRSWSLSDHAERPDRYRLSVKRIAGGAGSNRLYEIAAAGGTVWARPPAGRFVLKRDGFLRVVLISAGIGITPVLAMLKAHAARTDRPPPLLWIHQTRGRANHAFAHEVEAAAQSCDSSRHLVYSAPEAGDEGHDDTGRLTDARLRELLAPSYKTAPFGREIELEGAMSDFYICGPAGFEAMVRETLAAMGVAAGQIRSEAFRAAEAEPPPIAEARVHFGGTEALWTAQGNPSLLELAEAAGLAPDFGCRSGSCGACVSTLLAGEVEHSPAPAMLLEPGRILPCCARPASPVVRIGLG